jgi:hypothetical protein
MRIGFRTVYNCSLSCEERDRLTALYLAAIAKNTEAGKNIPDLRSEAWRDATHDTRDECGEALENLNRHKREDGC